MKRTVTLILLGIQLTVFGLASCSKDDDKKPTTTENDCRTVEVPKLVDKKWYRVGTNGTMWRIYKANGTWESSGGDTDTKYDSKGEWHENQNTVNGERSTPCYLDMIFHGSSTSSYMATWEKVVSLTDDNLKVAKIQTTASKWDGVDEYRTTP